MLLNQKDSLLLLIDVQEQLTPLVLHSDALISQCTWLLRLARKMDVPILVSEQYPKGLGSTVASLRGLCEAEDTAEKIYFSCMQQPEYVQKLHEFNKNQLILIGIEAHVCVLQTAIQMQESGFIVYVVVDAVSSRKEQDLKYGLKRMKQAGIHLITAEMVFFEWLRRADTPQFKALSQEFFKGKKSHEY